MINKLFLQIRSTCKAPAVELLLLYFDRKIAVFFMLTYLCSNMCTVLIARVHCYTCVYVTRLADHRAAVAINYNLLLSSFHVTNMSAFNHRNHPYCFLLGIGTFYRLERTSSETPRTVVLKSFISCVVSSPSEDYSQHQ